MRARTVVMNVGLVAIAMTHLWCGSSDDQAAPPSQDGGADSATPFDAAALDDAEASTASPECNAAFCRVSLSGIGTVALDGLLAKSASDVWVVGSTGFAAHFDGTRWARVETGTRATILGVTATQDGTVWGASSGLALLHLNRPADGGVEKIDGGFNAGIEGISAHGAELYAVGQMNEENIFPPPPLDHIWHYGPGPEGGVSEWLPISPPCPKAGEYEKSKCLRFHTVWVESAERQWFAGDDGKIFRTAPGAEEDGGGPGRIGLAEMNSRSLRRFNGLWGFTGNDIWAVGQQGTIRHWTGDTWVVVGSPVVTKDLYGVWGSRPDDVWAVGDDGAVIHWDGATWTERDIPFPAEQRPRFYAVAGTGSEIWIAGEGALLRSATGADR